MAKMTKKTDKPKSTWKVSFECFSGMGGDSGTQRSALKRLL